MMSADALASHAEQFAELLRRVNPAVKVMAIPATDAFIKVYQDPIPSGSGAYLFHTDGDVFYIGKAESFTRIWWHTKAAKLSLDGQMAFLNARLAVKKCLTEELRDAVLRGAFRVDYIRIDPPELADGLEVFLQSIYFAAIGRRPYGNEQFG